MKVLIVEDDSILSKNIYTALDAEGYLAENVYDGALALKLLRKNTYDIVIMDVNLPSINGFDLCKQFREGNKGTPIIMLTAFGDLDDKVKGYESGVDDYLTKPFFMKELLLRMQALLKRRELTGETKVPVITAGDIVINLQQKTVERQGKEINLTPREFQILSKLVKNQGDLVSKSELITEIWGSNIEANTNTIEVYINFLRNKIDKPFAKNSIKTKVGFGYYLDTNED